MTILAVTGHRPNRLGGYGQDVLDKLYVTACESLEQLAPSYVLTGMALGWDQVIAKACISLNIQFTAVLPFPGQEDKWPSYAKDEYRRLIEQASHVEIVSPPPYRPQKLHLRNQWLIDHCDRCLALWDGTRNGGTFECIQYAMVCGTPMVNAWDMFTGKLEYPSVLDKL